MLSTSWQKAEEKNKCDTQKIVILGAILNFLKIDFFLMILIFLIFIFGLFWFFYLFRKQGLSRNKECDKTHSINK